MGTQNIGPKKSDNATVAKSAGLAFLGQSSAIMEALALFAFTWLYPTAIVGLFFTLWAALKVLTAFTEFAMTTSQQRYTPASKSKAEQAQVLKTAVLTSTFIAFVVSGLLYGFAPSIAAFVEGGFVSEADLTTIIRIYVWALPLWTLVEVLTASVRAQHTFGPEIRVRVFYEQGVRLVAGVALFYAGFETFGLFYAHMFSITVAFALSIYLTKKFYHFSTFLKVPLDRVFLRDFLSYSSLLTPAIFIKKFFLVGSVIIVNKALGAEAAAIYGLGRHISSVLQVIHLSFEYVMAPFATLKNALAKKSELVDLYTFTTKLMIALMLPLGALLIFVSRDILTIFDPDYAAATGVIIIFSAGRITEAMMGTSAALVEMLGNRFLPLFNNLAGLTTLLVLQYYLKIYGVYGIAVATAIGFNVISLLSLAEAYFIYGLSPYHRATLRPFLVSSSLTALMIATFFAVDQLPHAIHFLIALISVFVALLVLINFGLSEKDAKSLGRIGRWFRLLGKKANITPEKAS